MKRTVFYAVLLTLLIPAFVSCSEETFSEEIDLSADIPQSHLDAISEMGFDIADIEQLADYYVVEGDIMLPKLNIMEYLAEDSPQTRQWRTDPIATNENVAYIGINFNIPLTTTAGLEWFKAVQSAISNWNSIPNCNVFFKLDPTISPSITINQMPGATPSGSHGRAVPPSGGKPGSPVEVNMLVNLNHKQKVYVVVHELGHCIGLRHSNWQIIEPYAPAVHIEGTPYMDSQSVMNGGTIFTEWSKFSTNDMVAVQKMYPYVNSYPSPPEITGPSTPVFSRASLYANAECADEYEWKFSSDLTTADGINKQSLGLIITNPRLRCYYINCRVKYRKEWSDWNTFNLWIDESIPLEPIPLPGRD